MGLTSSLTSGASSLRTHQRYFDIISDNIANANTAGFKSSRASFSDQLSQIYTLGKNPESQTGAGAGGMNPIQYGLGVRMSAITPDMSQGAIETTNKPFDLALQGDGFFVLNLNGVELFSRAGAFSRDRDGYLVNIGSGAFVMGYNREVSADGKAVKDADGVNILSRKVEGIQISSSTISEPKQTQNVVLRGNLNSSSPEGAERKTSITVFDALGGARTLALTFTKSATANEYTAAATIDGNAVALDSSTITFNADGSLSSPLELNITAADLNASLGSQLFDETTPKDLKISMQQAGNFGGSLTQFSGLNTVTLSEQDGLESGDLVGLSVDQQGKIWGSFTNGQSEILGRVVMAKFTNPEGLAKEGGGFYSSSPNSGAANIGTAGEIFPSTKIIGQALESSNVDLTTEFTEMISTQRAFEAASRTITVTDIMLGITNLLKR